MIFRSVLLLACSSLVGSAQITACPGETTPGYKVFFDRIAVNGATTPQSKLIQDRLIAKLRADLEQMRSATSASLTVVPCPGRSPSDPTDFRRQLLEAMNSNRVIVEVWGNVLIPNPSSTKQDATLSVALIPLWLDQWPDGSVPGVYEINYQGKIFTNSSLLDFFSPSAELGAYAAISLGIKAVKEHEWDQAFRSLCRGALILSGIQDSRDASPQLRKLFGFANDLSTNVVRLALSDSQYAGHLKLLDGATAAPHCPRGGI